MASEDEMGVIRVPNPNPSCDPNSNLSSESEMERGLGEMELDAARALADFAQMAKIGRGRRSRNQIKTESSQDLNISKSEHAYLVDDDPQDNKASEAVMEETIKVKQNSEFSISNVSCSSSHVSCFGRRMKQNMTEAEREARRICRVLANRESARQTIRRRQALHEELIKTVADLSMENKNMKMEKKLVMKEYLSLKDRNKELKEQMAKAIKSEVEVGAEIVSRYVDMATSPSTELSLAAPSQPSRAAWAPWPSISSDSAARYEEGDSSRAGSSRTLYHVPPCSLFYPLLNQTSEFYPPCCQATCDKRADFIAGQHGFRHCSQVGENLERASLHVGSTTDVLSTETAAIEEEKNAGINLEEMPIGFDGHDKISEHNPGETPTHLHEVEVANTCLDIKGVEEIGVRVDRITDHIETVVAEKSQVASIAPLEKLVDPSAAAAARKRRKELRKLKYIHRRQIRLQAA